MPPPFRPIRRVKLRREARAVVAITSTDAVSVAENATLSHALTANRVGTWATVAGNDAARFEISGSTLRWASNGTKDYETPNDANTNNTYLVTVRFTETATAETVDQLITATVTDVSEVTDITVTWGSGFAAGNIPDGTTAQTIATLAGVGGVGSVTFAEQTDAENKFSVSGSNLALSASVAYASDTSHSVTVRATAGGETFDKVITVQVLAPAAIDPGAYDSGTLVLSNGGKTVTKISGSGAKGAKGNSNKSGKSQFEFAIGALTSTMAVGIATAAVPLTTFPDGSAGNAVLYRSDGTIWKDGAQVASGYPTYTAGDYVMGAFDAATGKVWFGKNGSWQGSPSAGTGQATTATAGTYRLAVFLYDTADAVTIRETSAELSTALQSGFSPSYNVAPVITSGASFSVAENNTAISTLTATDADTGSTLTWSITGGADSAKFSITSGGVLTFATAPNYETPTDANTDNAYVVQVSVTDGVATTNQTVTVTVTDSLDTGWSLTDKASEGDIEPASRLIVRDNGPRLRVAIDFTAGKLWIADSSNNYWNGDSNLSNQNPATGAGGITWSATTGTLFPALSMYASTDVGRALFKQDHFVGSIPSGFSSWEALAGATTLSPSDKHSDFTVSEGNLLASNTVGGNWRVIRATTGLSSGKAYLEFALAQISGTFIFGFANASATLSDYLGSDSNAFGFRSINTSFRTSAAAGFSFSSAMAGWRSGRGLKSHSSGKRYFEATIKALADNRYTIIGFGDASASLANFCGSDTHGYGAQMNGGINHSSPAVTETNGSVAVNGTIGVAVDLDNDKAWFWNSASSNWNNDVIGNQNPATNTGGFSISDLGANVFPMWSFLQREGHRFESNFGSAAFVNTLPSGFSAWD